MAAMVATKRRPFLRILGKLSPRRRLTLALLSFVVPLAVWSTVSYVPFIWHPMIRVDDAGDASWFSAGELVDGDAFAEENQSIRAKNGHLATGLRSNPVFLPAPHRVARALVTGFTTPPARPEEPWLHQALWHSITIIFWGFAVSSIVGVPLGILCGALPAMARLSEPFIEVLSLPARAGLRRAGGGGAGDQRRAQGRDHLRRDLFPAGAGHREHHPPDRFESARGRPDIGSLAA